jgi:hypothetical protein
MSNTYDPTSVDRYWLSTIVKLMQFNTRGLFRVTTLPTPLSSTRTCLHHHTLEMSLALFQWFHKVGSAHLQWPTTHSGMDTAVGNENYARVFWGLQFPLIKETVIMKYALQADLFFMPIRGYWWWRGEELAPYIPLNRMVSKFQLQLLVWCLYFELQIEFDLSSQEQL